MEGVRRVQSWLCDDDMTVICDRYSVSFCLRSCSAFAVFFFAGCHRRLRVSPLLRIFSSQSLLHERHSHSQGRTGSSNRPWLIRLTGPISSCVTRNLGDPCTNVQKWPPCFTWGPWPPPSSTPFFRIFLFVTLSLAPFSLLPLYPSYVHGVGQSQLTYFKIWRGGPPGRRTNRPTWQVPGWQAAKFAPASWTLNLTLTLTLTLTHYFHYHNQLLANFTFQYFSGSRSLEAGKNTHAWPFTNRTPK